MRFPILKHFRIPFPVACSNYELCYLAIIPGKGCFCVTRQAYAFDAAARPLLWQGRQQEDFAVAGLNQHFYDGSGGAEVSVNLEWRMVVKEVA